MTNRPELDRLLAAFFVEGTDEVADRVIDAALDEIDQTPQRRVGRMPRRFTTMKTPMRVAAAAVIGVIAVGGVFYAIEPFQLAIGPSATPGNQASPSAGPSPTVGTAAPAWTLTKGLAAPRHGHTAMLLPDGKVLVVGGDGGAYELPSDAELYDPATASWSTMTEYRDGLSALLRDGTVLVLGFRGSAARYDPARQTLTATGRMVTVPRTGGDSPFGTNVAATVIGDGKVLVVGGESAELYDPASGSWTATGRMVAGRDIYGITLLADGRVLAIGSDSLTPRPIAWAEVYEPGSGTWTPTGAMSQARDNLTVTLLTNGKVLVVGGTGYGPVDFGHDPYIPDYRSLPSVGELYDPDAGTWAATGTMVWRHVNHTATLMADGTVLVVGGSGGLGDGAASAELYQPDTNSWTATVDMVRPRSEHSATLLPDGRVLVVGGVVQPGGTSKGAIVSSAEIYDPGDR